MAENKKSFIAYGDWQTQLDLLSDDEAGRLFRHLLAYVNDENPEFTNEDRILKIAFEPMRLRLNEDYAKSNKGSNHWNWKGGVSEENHSIRTSTRMKGWIISVFKRDSYKCQHCDKVGGKLNAHHIKPFAEYPKLRFEIDNGITLCENCHRKEHKRIRNER